MAVEAHHKHTQDSQVYVKGAMERVLEKCHKCYTAGGAVLPISGAERKKYLSWSSQMGCAGLRGEWVVVSE